MKIKKYTARTEQEAITQIKEELGLEALILNIKKIQPRGFFAFFRKPQVEVTAAYDDRRSNTARALAESKKPDLAPQKDNFEAVIAEQRTKIKNLEESLNNKDDLLGNLLSQLSAGYHNPDKGRKYENNMVQFFYDTLIEHGVMESVAEHILGEAGQIDSSEDIDINLIVKIVYNSIIRILGKPTASDISSEGCRKIIFIGPTGVGKTTTIAKLASDYALNQKRRLGLITADTYRIAAVEQLKTYAEILDIEVGVAYGAEDFSLCLNSLEPVSDIILVDTAGRSHRNAQTLTELTEILNICPDAQKYLVLSLTTKYEDLLSIITAYSQMCDFDIIFTKLDETHELGSILNICYFTNKHLSYITNGQNVPDDISVVEPEKIAKALLGLDMGCFAAPYLGGV